jgi:hypothetical protein
VKLDASFAMPAALRDAPLARARLQTLLGDAPPLRLRLTERTPVPASPAMRAERLTFASSGGETLRGFLAGPPGPWAGLPAVLAIHAHGGRYHIGADELLQGRPALRAPAYGEAFAAEGVLSLMIDLPCFGARQHHSEQTLAKALLWQGQTLFGAMLAELFGALDVMSGMPEIDPARLGAFGLSMGATLAFWLGALRPEVKAVAHLCCFADLATLVESGAHDLHGLYMTVPGLLPAFRTGEIAGLIAPRPQLACMGLVDPLTPPLAVERGVADLRAAYAAAGASERLSTLVSPDTGHVETPAMRAAVLDFFRRELHAHP